MTRAQEKATALLSRFVWERRTEDVDELALLGEIHTELDGVIATLLTSSSDRYAIAIRYLGDRRSVAA